jgi:hypothetical protein
MSLEVEDSILGAAIVAIIPPQTAPHGSGPRTDILDFPLKTQALAIGIHEGEKSYVNGLE